MKEEDKSGKSDASSPLGPAELKALNSITKAGYTPQEVKQFIDALQRQGSASKNTYRVGKSHARVGWFGDTHFGNVQYDPALMKYAAKQFTKEKVDFVIHSGDICDGWYQNRPTSLFEQNAIGFDRQMKMAVEELSQIEQPLYFITGNHEYNTFVRGAGVEMGPYLEDKLIQKGLQAKFLGNAEGRIKLKSGTLIDVLHPDGGTAYALSYRPQKIVESMESGNKPHILGIGHFHKAMYMFYRNVHVLQTGTFEGQTKFMRGKHIPAHLGFWIVDIYSRSGGQVDKLVPQFFPSYG